MVQPNNRHTIALNFEHFKVSIGLDAALQPSQQMTGLKFAISQMKELSTVQDLKLMFDKDNQTTEEEILEQGITDVLMVAANMADLIRIKEPEP